MSSYREKNPEACEDCQMWYPCGYGNRLWRGNKKCNFYIPPTTGNGDE